jgi:16S rRNA (cytidine1402-2'-O)-methyltransferase
MTGTLYIVATPIGNLEDITYRAVQTLRDVDLIACEDTRQTRKLLNHYGISKPTVSYHEHNEQARSADLIAELQRGRNIALVSDAGTPLIADPGYRLVARAREEGIHVVPIPGPSAVLAALSASGLPTDSFLFYGFLPAKPGQRRKALEECRTFDTTIVLYEAPHRILATLEEIGAVLGSRQLVLAREISKIHEEFLSGTAAHLTEVLNKRGSVRGELTIIVGRAEKTQEEESTIEDAVEHLIRNGVERMDALKQVARSRGLSKSEVYKRFL